MIVASFVAYLLRTNMSVAGAPMAADLGLSQRAARLGAGRRSPGATRSSSSPAASSAIGSAARRALTLLAVLWGVLNLLVAFVPGARSRVRPRSSSARWPLLRFLMGAAQAPLFPIIGGGTTCHWFPVSGWALPNALQNAGAHLRRRGDGPADRLADPSAPAGADRSC